MTAVGNWILETTNTIGTGIITLGGAVAGFASFASAIPEGDVWYSIEDSNGNREAGIGSFDGDAILIRTTVKCTLVGNTYNDVNPTAISLSGDATVACTFSVDAYEELLDQIANVATSADLVSYNPAGDTVSVAVNVQNALIEHANAITAVDSRVDTTLRTELLAEGGADRVGKVGGGTVQDFIDASDIPLRTDLAASDGTDLIGYGDSTLSVALPQNIKQWGGLSDGVTDAAPALRAAIASLSAVGGGQLFIPPGTYLMQSLIGDAPFQRFADLISNIEIIGIPGKSIFKAAAGLSVSNQWNFLVGEFDADFENIKISGITFDFNGANNLTPVGDPYRPCTAVWVLANGTAGVSGKNIEVSNCQFLDNPGSNSVSCVDAAPTGGINALSNVRINDNIFDGHGYVLNGLGAGVYNANNDDHSCIYAQFESGEIKGNLFKQREPEPDAVSVGHSCIDHHSSDLVVCNNRSKNVQTFIAHQSSGAQLKRTIISHNILYGVQRLYSAFEGTYNIEDVKIASNMIGLHASNRNMPVVDIANGIGSTLVFNFSLENNDLTVVSGSVSGKNAPFIKTTGIGNLLISGDTFNALPGQLLLATPTTNITNLVVRDVNVYGWGAGNVSGSKDLINIDNTAGVTVKLSVRGGEASEGATGSTRDSIIRLKGTISSVISEGVKIGDVSNFLSSVDSYTIQTPDIKYHKADINYIYSASKVGFVTESAIGSRLSTDEVLPSVGKISLLRVSSTSAHQIINFLYGVDGQMLTLYALSGGVTVQNNAYIANTSGSNILMPIYSRLTYIYSANESAWFQI